MAEHYRQRRERAAWFRTQRALSRYDQIAAYIADGHSNGQAVAIYEVCLFPPCNAHAV